jgi:hypothetical protein
LLSRVGVKLNDRIRDDVIKKCDVKEDVASKEKLSFVEFTDVERIDERRSIKEICKADFDGNAVTGRRTCMLIELGQF